MKPKIKSITAYSRTNDTDDVFKSAYTEFDKHGNEIMSINYISENEIETKIVSKYNEQGYKTEELNYITEDEIGEHTIIERDADNVIQNIKIVYTDGSESIKNYHRDTENNIVTIETVDDEDILEEKEVIKHTGTDEILERCVYDENNNLVEKTVNQFDEEKHLINAKEYDENENLRYERKFYYDDKGNLTKRVSITKDNKLMDMVTIKYDDKNRILEQTIDKSYIIKHIYDDEGRLHTEMRFAANGMKEFEIVQKFDENELLIEEKNMMLTTNFEYEFFS